MITNGDLTMWYVKSPTIATCMPQGVVGNTLQDESRELLGEGNPALLLCYMLVMYVVNYFLDSLCVSHYNLFN